MPRMTEIAATTEPLWIRARAMFARAVTAIGNPAAIAVMAQLSKTLRRDIIAWLAPLECIVRRLLIADASELQRVEVRAPNCAPRVEMIQLRSLGLAHHAPSGSARPEAAQCARSPKTPPGAARSLDTSHPESWSARFSYALPRDTRLAPNPNAPRIRALWGPYTPPPETPSRTPRAISEEHAPFRLARRLEALRRVLADPRPHAERLARLLARQARRIPRLVQRYVWAGARTDDVDPADPRLSLDALAAAFDAPDAYKDTS
jgi:hypothetical protein